ncbi:MAG: protein translocase subunit SecF [Candidatus Levybacteria bacterium]|nr:protein translocase subunit SecF [Candidatus Levybacteria bacterium]
MNIIGKKYLYFLISVLVIIPGLVSLFLFGLNFSIDFTGGSRIAYQVTKSQVKSEQLKSAIQKKGVEVQAIQKSGKDVYIVRTKPMDIKIHERITKELTQEINGLKEISFETVGPVIGSEITTNAIKAVILSSVLIVLYIAWSFRKVPKPASSWRFGICAIIALLHDVLVVIGIFSILGHFWHVEVDSLFVTALLTIIGFSVHDTIVVFDRIRENLRISGAYNFNTVVNDSIIQTLGRSLNTSLTVILVLFTLLLFGGESTKWFVVALLIGITSGTYSSIFNAAPLLVVWEEWSRKRKT